MKLSKELIESLKYAQENAPFYQKRFANLVIDENLDYNEFIKIPFTTKFDLTDSNSEFRAVPLQKITEYATTSGTSGKPITMYLTANDLERLAYNEASSLRKIGATSDDVIQLMTTMDRQFMAGLAYFLGVQKLGAGMVRIGPGVPSLQWQSIIENEVTVLIAVPSFIVQLLNFAQQNDIDFKSTKVKKILAIGEPIRDTEFNLNRLGKKITDCWDIELYSTYASTEMTAAFTECTSQNGGHLMNDLLFLEVLDDNDKPVNDGQIGEIVVTSLNVEGTPLIRYRTGDLAHYYQNECSCGLKTPRLGPIIGRKNQMIKFKGTTLFPNSIFDVLDQNSTIQMYKLVVSKDELQQDLLTVLLPTSIREKLNINGLIEACRSNIKVVPNFEFIEDEQLLSKIYKTEKRKPEKITFLY